MCMYGRFPAPVTRESGVGKSSQLIHLLHFDRAYHKCPRGWKTFWLHHKAEVGIYLESAWLASHKKKKRERKKKKKKLTKGMAAAQLRLLRVFALKLISNCVQQLQVTLLWPLLQWFNKRPTQCTTRLSVLECIRPVSGVSLDFLFIDL